jgi:hypothetical protein
MEDWKSIGDIISKFDFKGKAKNKALKEILKERIKRIFDIQDDFDLEFSKGILELGFKNHFLAQEIFFQKERIKKEANKILKEEKFLEKKVNDVLIKKI